MKPGQLLGLGPKKWAELRLDLKFGFKFSLRLAVMVVCSPGPPSLFKFVQGAGAPGRPGLPGPGGSESAQAGKPS